MNSQMSRLLEHMKTQLTVEAPVWGPDGVLDEDHGEPGEGGAENESDVMDAFDLYLSSILDALLEQYDADEDEALDFIFAVAEEMADAGELPEMPSDDADATEVTAWVGTATTAGFTAEVLKAAEEESEEGDEE